MLAKLKYRLFDFITKRNAYQKFKEAQKLQWLSYSELVKIQNDKLKKLVCHAYENTVYYRDLFDNLGLKSDDIQKKEDLVKLPILTKAIIKENYDKFKAKDINKFVPRERATSGSTGNAFHYILDKETHSWVHGYLLLSWNVAGFEFGDKVMTIGGGYIKHSSLKKRVIAYLRNSVDLSSFDYDEKKLKESISTVNKVKPSIIYGYSSAMAFIAKFAIENNIKIFSPKAIVTTSENLLPHNKERIEKAFGCKVFDQYGVPECGVYTYECDRHEGYHLCMTKGILEVVNDNGEQLLKEKGKIISTDLDNYAFPLIRYETGDVGEESGRLCSCGRGFVLLDSIDGRTREFITTKDNKKVHGAIFSYLVRDNPWINQFQVYQKEAGKIEVRIVCNEEIDKVKESSVSKFINKQCGDTIDTVVIKVDDIPLSANEKRHFVVSEIKNI